MKHRSFLVAVVLGLGVPVVTLAQDDNVICKDYLAMDAADQLAAIDAALAKSEERGSGRRFAADATDQDKLDYIQTSCTEWEGAPTIALIDMLGA